MASKWLPGYTYDASSGRYRRADTGRFVKRDTITDLLETSISQRARDIRKGFEAVLNEELGTTPWLHRTAQQLKREHLELAALAAGGWDRLTPADYARIDGRLNFDFKHLATMAREISEGTVSLAQGLNRLDMYLGSARREYLDIERNGRLARVKDGYALIAKRHLAPHAIHCQDCEDMALWPWRPADVVPVPTEACLCGNACRCDIEYKETPLVYMEMAEFNPYHDEKGRFATGGSAGRFPVSTPAYLGVKGEIAKGPAKGSAFELVGHDPGGYRKPPKWQVRYLDGPLQGQEGFITYATAKFKGEAPNPTDVNITPNKDIPLSPAGSRVGAILGDGLILHDRETQEVRGYLNDLGKFPERTLAQLRDSGVKWHLGNRPVTRMDTLQDLTGVRPEGWKEGSSWDQVRGIYDGRLKNVVVGKGAGGSASAVGHETGHAIAAVLKYHADPRITAEYKKVYSRLNPYEKQDGPDGYRGKQEWFAEVIARHISGQQDWQGISGNVVDILKKDGWL